MVDGHNNNDTAAVRGKVNLFSRGTLIGMAAMAGMALIVKVTRQKVPASKRRLHRRGLTP